MAVILVALTVVVQQQVARKQQGGHLEVPLVLVVASHPYIGAMVLAEAAGTAVEVQETIIQVEEVPLI